MLLKTVGSTCLKTFLQRSNVLQIPIQSAGHWLRDHAPEPKPPVKTEEILAAAEKYNLLPSEYKTFPDDGFGYGDYPNLPLMSSDAKDKNYPYDNPELRRNFNEPLHVLADILIEERCNRNIRLRKSQFVYLLETLGVFATLWTIYIYLEDKKKFLPLLRKQFPGDECQIHYTFEQKPPKKKDECEYCT
ncbi:NADH dehydrogenase [ubiquinone] 1 beta subcomplex subunit 8, mitochondrial-like [Agrilus planipennis]|uniref:NADH dehydrogenase [ubiquinone] 1 beta subcomplex subunit 8, mitochondrial-like n=1 Tax=Agrilus planipennis TaxID=224129 RepID=A0A1W4X5N5_AGRPL|nr:NADH dehydrogenase [ubiquinone] 1 beta subcomplex subunit 8, mitochondrial-like [Agrilus planipennis]